MLTSKQVTAAKRPGRYHDGRGLYLQVRSADAKSWLFIYARGGRQHYLGLGRADVISLKAARDKVHDLHKLIADGHDPLQQKRVAKVTRGAIPTFKEAAEEYVRLHKAGWRNAKTAKTFLRAFELHAYGVLGPLPVNIIGPDEIVRVLSPIFTSTPVMAEHLRANIAMVLDACTARGQRTGENPARRPTLSHLMPSVVKLHVPKHHAAIPYRELPALMRQLSEHEGIAPQALRFTVLTAVRTNETIGARWPEIDLKRKIWTIPAARMKAQREHRVPLSSAAVKVLQALPREKGSEFVFPGGKAGRGLSNMAMLSLLKELRPDATVHGMRAAFRTWASERTKAPREVAEAALAHLVGDATERAYARSDLFVQRRALMARWATFVAK